MNLTPDDIEILYQDEQLIAVNKPEGLLVHRGWGRDPIVLLGLVRDRIQQKLYPVHRLDRGTSGVVVFALNPEAARHINEHLARGQAYKRYLTLAVGTPEPFFSVDKPLTRKKDGPRVPACTFARRLYAMEYYSIVEVAPQTGRLHQIRRHLHHADHAVIGDKKYGYRWKNNFNRDKYGLERMALHAWCLHLPHPTLDQVLTFVAPLPPDLMGPFDRMKIPQRVWDTLYANPHDPWTDRFPPFVPEAGPATDESIDAMDESADDADE